MSGKTALLLLAEGAEEMESVITIDVLRRAKIEVTVAGLDEHLVKCSRNVRIQPDDILENIKDKMYDAVIIPGGLGGAKKLSESTVVKNILEKHFKHEKLIAAICAGPTVLDAHNVGKGKKVTSYPSLKDKMKDYTYVAEKVVTDGNLVTSQGPGTSFNFSLEIVKILVGSDIAEEVSTGMLL
ncbi:Parkinson disease protein 7 homolog [Hydra vulgaris]|uniref:Protein DJ-1 n=1 Tax=Hydra vulgaris TaxID=6087 RepID=T2M6B2_HYDVU|nr:Parkinson disease protein 7 homolog [Hydra vulgaris]